MHRRYLDAAVAAITPMSRLCFDRADVQRLRDVGLEDRAIHDLVQVISYFNYITRVAEGLGVVPETFISPWGQPAVRPESER